MSHALGPSADPPDMPCRTKWLIGDLSTVECLHTIAGGIAEGNHLCGTTLVGNGRDFPAHSDAGIFQALRQRGESRSVRDLPAEKTLPIRQAAIGDEALLAVIHAEGTHGAPRSTGCSPSWPVAKLV